MLGGQEAAGIQNVEEEECLAIERDGCDPPFSPLQAVVPILKILSDAGKERCTTCSLKDDAGRMQHSSCSHERTPAILTICGP